jgi:Mg-chelatase subunit ChlD
LIFSCRIFLKPRGGTPLFDAIGLAIHDLENVEESTDENKVLVIVTDGFENASKEYTFENISSKIKEKEEAGWLDYLSWCRSRCF